jgi:hypothetical protein
MDQVSTLPAFVRPSEAAALTFTRSIPQFIGLRDLPGLKRARSDDPPVDPVVDELDGALGSIKVQLADKISADQLAAFLDVAGTTYSDALRVERAGAESTDLGEKLWIRGLEIGTPNWIELVGNPDALVQVAGYLGLYMQAVLLPAAEAAAALLPAVGIYKLKRAQAEKQRGGDPDERRFHEMKNLMPRQSFKVSLLRPTKVRRN